MTFRVLRYALLSLFLSLFIVACADGSAPDTAGEEGEAAPTSGQMHWTNDQPIGLGMGGVDGAMLERGLEDPSQWLLYGGNYANFRHSPIERLTPEAVPNLRVA